MSPEHALSTMHFHNHPPLRWPGTSIRSTVAEMAAGPSTMRLSRAAEPDEVQLAHAAAGGDGQAFATLYERYEGRAFNLAFRITGSRDDAADATQEAFLNVMRRLPSLRDRDLVFGSYLFTAARNASYDLIEKRQRATPSDEIPESAAPVGPGGKFDPGDPEDDPERGMLLEAQQEEIRLANERLPARQREVLALRELEEMSYDDIAEIMDLNRNSVAQLISRARLKLRDELRGTALESIGASSPECERALPLISLRGDDELAGDVGEGDWLTVHVASCETCRLRTEAMQEAGASYRAWAPIVAAPILFRDTMAKAAEITGSNWDAVIEERAARHGARLAGASGSAWSLGASAASASAALRRHRRRDVGLVAAVAIVLLLALFEGGLHDADRSAPTVPAATQGGTPSVTKPSRRSSKTRRGTGRSAAASARTPGAPAATRTATSPTTRGSAPRSNRAPARRRVKQVSPRKEAPPVARAPEPVDPAPQQPVTPPLVQPPATVQPPAPAPAPAICRDAAGRQVPCP